MYLIVMLIYRLYTFFYVIFCIFACFLFCIEKRDSLICFLLSFSLFAQKSLNKITKQSHIMFRCLIFRLKESNIFYILNKLKCTTIKILFTRAQNKAIYTVATLLLSLFSLSIYICLCHQLKQKKKKSLYH